MKGVFNMAFSIDELTKKAKDMAAAAADKAKGAADLAKINVDCCIDLRLHSDRSEFS